MRTLEERILESLAYHGLFDFPLTAHEVRLAVAGEAPPQLQEVLSVLERLRKAERVDAIDGLWHLAGQERAVTMRKERYDLAEPKYRRARRFFRFARHAPFLRAVYVCNTLARSNARSESDIDLFIVAASGRIWLTRLFVTGFAKLLGIRPDAKTSKDRLCLSFFSTEDALDLRGHAIENDVYLPNWLADLYPIYDESGITSKIHARNPWARERMPGILRQMPSARRIVRGGKSRLKHVLERAVDREAFERQAKAFQLRIMPEELRSAAGKGTGVVITDTTLKLHGLDRRHEIRDRFVREVAARREDDASEQPANVAGSTERHVATV